MGLNVWSGLVSYKSDLASSSQPMPKSPLSLSLLPLRVNNLTVLVTNVSLNKYVFTSTFIPLLAL